MLQAGIDRAGLRRSWRTADQTKEGGVIPLAKAVLIRAPLPLYCRIDTREATGTRKIEIDYKLLIFLYWLSPEANRHCLCRRRLPATGL